MEKTLFNTNKTLVFLPLKMLYESASSRSREIGTESQE